MKNIPILRFENISKSFGSHLAVNQLNLEIHPGEILALLGENGAGKSTLIKILAGIHKADGGTLYFHGHPINSALSLQHAIAFIHQDLGLIEWFTIAENIALTLGFPRKFGLIDWKKVRSQAENVLAKVGLDLSVDTRIFDLTRTEKSLLAIARAIATNAEILVLDEPTASLPAQDVTHLFSLLHRLRQQGVSMIYVSHRLDEIKTISDRLLVMRDGSCVTQGKTCDYTIEQLTYAISGKKVQHQQIVEREKGKEILSLNHVCVDDIGPISFSLHQGEIISLTGLNGAGQEEIGRLLFGCKRLDQGYILHHQLLYQANSPEDAIRQGIGFVASDRTQESVIMSMNIQENLFLNPESITEEKKLTSKYISQFDIRPTDATLPIHSLSGGNQQKVVLARWLHLNTPILILEDPTAGVDVGAKAEIYQLLNQAVNKGLAVLLISTDFEEVVQLSHQALVFRQGKICATLSGEQLSTSNLLLYATGDISSKNGKIEEKSYRL